MLACSYLHIIIDYDTTNRNLQIVDKGFIIWLASQDRAELINDLSMTATPPETESS